MKIRGPFAQHFTEPAIVTISFLCVSPPTLSGLGVAFSLLLFLSIKVLVDDSTIKQSKFHDNRRTGGRSIGQWNWLE